MLASITPFGERGRHNRWWLTVTAHLLGSVVGGVVIGTALGLVGQVLLSPLDHTTATVVALGVLAVGCAAGLVVDLGWWGLRLPTNHRQVNERWIDTYRGWVYGFGFGFQLGLGIVTIVTTSATYLTLAAAGLSGSWQGGFVVGLVFGLARCAPILLAHRAVDPAALRELIGRSQTWIAPTRRVALIAQGATAVAATLALLEVR